MLIHSIPCNMKHQNLIQTFIFSIYTQSLGGLIYSHKFKYYVHADGTQTIISSLNTIHISNCSRPHIAPHLSLGLHYSTSNTSLPTIPEILLAHSYSRTFVTNFRQKQRLWRSFPETSAWLAYFPSSLSSNAPFSLRYLTTLVSLSKISTPLLYSCHFTFSYLHFSP